MTEDLIETKMCPYCGETIRAEAIKCRFCGEMLSNSAQPGQPVANTPARPGPGPRIDSVTLYRGGPSLVTMLGSFIKNGVILAIAAFICFFPVYWLGSLASGTIVQAFERYRFWGGLVVLITVVLVVLFQVLKIKTISYLITSDRLEFERGIFSKKVDNLDLFRIKDINLKLPFFDRILGVGSIRLDTSDQSHPVFDTYKIRKPRQLYDILKRASLEADTRGRVVHYE